MSGMVNNPLYQGVAQEGVNPLYTGPQHKYPSQLIVQFLSGSGDHTITRGSQAINTHGKELGISSSIVTILKSSNVFRTFSKASASDLEQAMQRLSALSRVYLRGHGDWGSQKIGDWGPHNVADLLADSGMPQVRVVSVTGCELGRDRGTANNARIGNSINSFASKFHRRLGEKHGIYTVVYARAFRVGVGNSEEEAGQPALWGKKFTFNQNDDWEDHTSGHDRANSKVKFYWQGGQQCRDVIT